jgi:DNA-dependent RNA polymerase auxiliary subunit epsilon
MGNNYSEKEKQIQHERDLQRLQEFRLMDDTFMRAVLKDNLKAAQYILRVVTGLSDLVLTYEKTQEDM